MKQRKKYTKEKTLKTPTYSRFYLSTFSHLYNNNDYHLNRLLKWLWLEAYRLKPGSNKELHLRLPALQCFWNGIIVRFLTKYHLRSVFCVFYVDIFGTAVVHRRFMCNVWFSICYSPSSLEIIFKKWCTTSHVLKVHLIERYLRPNITLPILFGWLIENTAYGSFFFNNSTRLKCWSKVCWRNQHSVEIKSFEWDHFS